MANLLKMAGFHEEIISGFADDAFDLMHQLTDSLRNMDGQAANILLEAFNDFSCSMAIITYIKVRLALRQPLLS